MISVVIPVKDGGSDLVRCLEAIAAQRIDEEVEIVVVDSGSSDGSQERARALGARVHEISPESFTHGGARNLGARHARGDVLVFTTQDAFPADEHWLAALVAPLRRDPELAGVYGRQLPHDDAIPSERYFLDFLYGSSPRTQRLAPRQTVSFEATLFSNVNAAIPHAVWEAFPFADDLIMSEDQEWSRRILLAGRAIAYEPRAAVRHSHAYSVSAAFRRFFDSGASAQRAYVGEQRSSRQALTRAGIRYALGELRWLWRTGQRRWIPFAAVYESAKFIGLQAGLRHERLPAGLKRRLSGLPGYWSPATRRDGRLHVCLVYDHLFPQTVGGAERWLRDLALHLARSGHRVTYLTMRHWDAEHPPELEGVDVIGLTRAGRVYRLERRTLLPPLRFGVSVARHLLEHGDEYDVVHMASFPYFPLLAAAALRRRARYDLVVNWIEIWTRGYWLRYAGPVVGVLGWLVQAACVRVPHRALCLSRLHADRLVAEGFRGRPDILPGLYSGPVEPTPLDDVDPALVVFAGRHVQEKRVGHLLRAFAAARRERPDLRLELYGDGPERGHLERLARDLGLGGSLVVHGRRPEAEVERAVARASCLATASEREGYGLIVVEAAAHGTPSVVVAGPENAATELVHDGVNGVVARDPSPEVLGAALVRVVDAGPALRESTSRWFADNVGSLTIEGSLELVIRTYRELRAHRGPEVRSRS